MIHFFKEFESFLKLLALLALSAFLVYYVPVKLNRALFLLFLIPIWKSKNDYFWFAFIFVLLEYPGGLFSGVGVDDPYRLPIYNLDSDISFAFEDLYFIILMLKGLSKYRWFQFNLFVYKKQYRNLGIYLILMIFISLLLGASIISIRNTFKTLILLSIYFSTMYIFVTEDDVIGFFKTLFPFAFLAILFQMYGMLFHQQFIALFKPGITATQGILVADQLMRPIELSTILLCCFFGGFLYLDYRNNMFSKNYLILIIVASYIGIWMTATRSWFIAFSIMFVFHFIINIKKLARNALNISTGLVLILLIFYYVPQIKYQTDQSWTRLKTIESLFEGDLTANGTMIRLTIRGPRVMEGFFKSSILFGAGFSDLYYKYGDGHVGFQSILLNTGIIGSILLFLFALTLFFKPLGIAIKLDDHSDMKSILLSLPLLVPAVLVINSGTQFWGYGVSEPARVMLLAFYICISSVYINAYKYSSSTVLEG